MNSTGHYWCQSSGEIPPGAVKAGVDKDGGDVFVGRAFHQGEVIPAKVVPNQNIAFVAWNGEEHPKEEFEVGILFSKDHGPAHLQELPAHRAQPTNSQFLSRSK